MNRSVRTGPMAIVLTTSLMVVLVLFAVNVEARPWTTQSGEKLDAAFVSLEPRTQMVTLRDVGSKQLKVIALSRLSPVDQEIAVEQWKAALPRISIEGTIRLSFPHHDETDYHLKWQKLELLYPGFDDRLRTMRAATPPVQFVGPDERHVLTGNFKQKSIPLDLRLPIMARMTFTVVMNGRESKNFVLEQKIPPLAVEPRDTWKLQEIVISVDRTGSRVTGAVR